MGRLLVGSGGWVSVIGGWWFQWVLCLVRSSSALHADSAIVVMRWSSFLHTWVLVVTCGTSYLVEWPVPIILWIGVYGLGVCFWAFGFICCLGL